MATVNLSEANFSETIENNNIVIIDFWAPWCGPCKQFGPIYEKTSEQYPDIVFGKVNTEDEQALAGQFQIRSIPTTIIIKENIAVFQQPGVMPEEGLKDVIRQVQELDMDMVRQELEKQQQAENAK
ncbi:thioredoxin [Sulfurovum sp.]|uniref:thioredoxin n=1 Tax=Sulfurovum sp. TaxID=1969726 RepID=UPI0035669B3E